MAGYALRRTLAAVALLVAATVVVFMIVHLLPGDPVQIMSYGARMSPSEQLQLRHQLGLDKPIVEQYFNYAGRLLHGNFGTSVRDGTAVSAKITANLGLTLVLTLAGTIVATLVGGFLGSLAALRPDGVIDRVAMGATVVVLSMPAFWLALVLVILFAVELPWFPVVHEPGLRGLVLPALALGLPYASVTARTLRGRLLESYQEQYIQSAEAKGASRARVFFQHALRNSLIPVVTIVGLNAGNMLATSVVVEAVFGRPGLGQVLIQAILQRDYPTIQGVVLVFAAAYIAINLTVDGLYAVLNPRIRLG